MKGVLDWIKGNPITVASALVALVSIVMLFIVGASGRALTTRMAERDDVVRKIASRERTAVTIPPTKPDEPERGLTIAVNPAAIGQLNTVYKHMEGEYKEIFKLAVELNQLNHFPMGDGLFPQPVDLSRQFDARSRYRQVFQEMLGGYSPNAIYPRLNAGVVPGQERITATMSKAGAEFRANNFFPSADGRMGSEELNEMDRFVRRRLIQTLQKSAETIHLYVDSTAIDEADFPFDVGAWSARSERPEMAELWEGQLGLWIQQDIAEAISRANRVDDPRSNVTNAPVKRLISIRVEPGYAGLQGLGDVPGLNPGRALRPPVDSDDRKRLYYDFTVSPTGRRSNTLYDVRHARVDLIVDYQKLPALFEMLQNVNFMTVLDIDVQGVDEYEALKEGYVYGSGDAVRIQMLIESIWLRDWTTGYMPRSVRDVLLAEPEAPEVEKAKINRIGKKR